MRLQNKSYKRYSSFRNKVTISDCLLKCFIIFLFVNYSDAWFFGFNDGKDKTHVKTHVNNESVSTGIKLFDDPENITTKPTDDNPWPIVNCTECEFSCHSKRLCIKLALVCDGINDCNDGSDELSCVDKTPDKRQYLQECGCVRTSFSDKTCFKDKEPYLLFSMDKGLFKGKFLDDPSKVQLNSSRLGGGIRIKAFEYRTSEDLLIWLDDNDNKIFTGKVNLEQNSDIYERQIAVNVPHQIRGFVFDWMNYSIIWIDDHAIRSVKIDSTSFSPMNETKLYRALKPLNDMPGPIAIDVKKQCIFWVNRGNNPFRPRAFSVYIERIDLLNKPKIKRIVDTAILRPIGLAVDTENSVVYWVDGALLTLNSIRYDGTNRIIFYDSLELMHANIPMDIYSNYLYFPLWIRRSIQSINIINSTNIIDDRLKDASNHTIKFYGKILGLKILDPIKQENELPKPQIT